MIDMFKRNKQIQILIIWVVDSIPNFVVTNNDGMQICANEGHFPKAFVPISVTDNGIEI